MINWARAQFHLPLKSKWTRQIGFYKINFLFKIISVNLEGKFEKANYFSISLTTGFVLKMEPIGNIYLKTLAAC